MNYQEEIEKLKADCLALEDQVKLLVRTELKLRRTQAELLQSKETIEEYSRTLEQKVEERTKELKTSELQYRRLFESATDGILILDFESGAIHDINPSLSGMIGYPKEEITGKMLWEIIFFKDLIDSKTFFKGLRENEFVKHEDLSLKTRTGQYVDVEFVSNVYFEGAQKAIQCNFRDISERKQAENLRLEKESAEAANRAKSEFLSHMSHEIRTPMNAIIGFSEILVTSLEGEEERSQVEIILNNANKLIRIINDILDLSKIEAGELKIEPSPVNINSIVKDIQNMFFNKTNEKGISFLVERGNGIPPVLILDELRIRQILINLIDNAFKFTNEGTVKLSLDQSSRPGITDKIKLTIAVEDTGIGIPPEQQNLIFEAFKQQQGQNTKTYGGTGLGLTITKKLVEMMKGVITVSSTPGQGSALTVILPDVLIPDQEIPGTGDPVFNPKSLLFKRAKILICDDNPDDRKLIVNLLRSSPLTFFECENGKDAIKAAVQYQPDLILMDLTLPEMNGYNALRIIRRNIITMNIPVIAISVSIPKMDEKEGDQFLFNDYLVKPFSLTEFFGMIKKYLQFKAVGNE